VGSLPAGKPRGLSGLAAVVSRAPQPWGQSLRVFLTPLEALPDPPWGIAMQKFLRESLYKLCVDPLTLGPCGAQVARGVAGAAGGGGRRRAV
jgi:hypothetical protein